MKLVVYVAAAALAFTCASASAAPAYTGNVVFGDSLSDQGNAAEYLGHNFPTPPFYHDSFTNGQVAVQVLDNRLGLATNPSLFVTGGRDLYSLGLTPVLITRLRALPLATRPVRASWVPISQAKLERSSQRQVR